MPFPEASSLMLKASTIFPASTEGLGCRTGVCERHLCTNSYDLEVFQSLPSSKMGPVSEEESTGSSRLL